MLQLFIFFIKKKKEILQNFIRIKSFFVFKIENVNVYTKKDPNSNPFKTKKNPMSIHSLIVYSSSILEKKKWSLPNLCFFFQLATYDLGFDSAVISEMRKRKKQNTIKDQYERKGNSIYDDRFHSGYFFFVFNWNQTFFVLSSFRIHLEQSHISASSVIARESHVLHWFSVFGRPETVCLV